jgi:hypothetical protein
MMRLAQVVQGGLAMARIAGPFCWIGLALALGCTESPTQVSAEGQEEPLPAACHFDPATAGTIHGQVLWSGEMPNVPSFEVHAWAYEGSPPQGPQLRPNPHAPQINPDTRGVHGAVVFLRGVDPERSRPWDHAAVVVEHKDRRLEVLQGGKRSSIGFVRRGEAVTLVSRESVFNALTASGAAFFTLTFPDPNQPLKRNLRDRGHVELSSNAGWYWMRAHLFVDSHPYYVLTSENGSFRLPQVPPGRYQIVCWMPSWQIARQERDPESALVTRLFFQPPVEMSQYVSLEPGGEVSIQFDAKLALFGK